MATELSGRRVAFVVSNEGVEQAELTKPWEAVKQAGGQPVLIATEGGKVQAFQHLDKGDTFDVDLTTEEAKLEDYDGLVLPGGVANADQLRTDPAAVELVGSFFTSGRPVAVICHGPWAIVEADQVRGRTMTSWPSLQTDIRNAGGTWVDKEVQVCTGGPNVLVSSRKPDDLPAFNQALLQALSEYTATSESTATDAADDKDRAFGAAASRKEERLDEAILADEPLPPEPDEALRPEPEGAGPRAGGKAPPA